MTIDFIALSQFANESGWPEWACLVQKWCRSIATDNDNDCELKWLIMSRSVCLLCDTSFEQSPSHRQHHSTKWFDLLFIDWIFRISHSNQPCTRTLETGSYAQQWLDEVFFLSLFRGIYDVFSHKSDCLRWKKCIWIDLHASRLFDDGVEEEVSELHRLGVHVLNLTSSVCVCFELMELFHRFLDDIPMVISLGDYDTHRQLNCIVGACDWYRCHVRVAEIRPQKRSCWKNNPWRLQLHLWQEPPFVIASKLGQ